MKRIVTLFFVAFMFNFSFAKNASFFSYDKAKVDVSLATVNVVSKFLDNHPMDYESLMSDMKVLSSLAEEAHVPASSFSEMMRSWSFWGNFGLTAVSTFVLGLIGIGCGLVGVLAVYLITQDTDQTLNALIGCVAGVVIAYGCWFVIYGTLMATSS